MSIQFDKKISKWWFIIIINQLAVCSQNLGSSVRHTISSWSNITSLELNPAQHRCHTFLKNQKSKTVLDVNNSWMNMPAWNYKKVSYCLKCFALLNSSASVSPTIHHPPPTISETLYIKILQLHKSKMIKYSTTFIRLCWNSIFSVNCAAKRYDNSGTHDRVSQYSCDFYVCSGEGEVTCTKQKMYTSEYTQ